MIWREATNHTNDCYFCLINTQGFTAKNKSKIKYPIINSAILPVTHSDDLPIPVFSRLPQDEVLSQACHSVNKICETTNRDLSETESQTTESEEDDDNQDFDFSLPPCSNETTNKTPDTFNQGELNDLVRDLCLSKESVELLASRLAEKCLLSKGINISYYRDRDREFRQFFSSAESFVYCNDVPNLLLLLGIDSYNTTEWRLFIDSSKRSLKCVLLHNGNEYASIPLAHLVHAKEGYDEVKEVLDLIKYKEHNWICADLKMVNFLLGQQSGYTKFPCFICLWDSRARDKHWGQKDWLKRIELNVGDKNIINKPLVQRKKIVFPPLHTKLGLMKQFVKALDKEGSCFQYFCTSFPNLSIEKLTAGVFDGPQIRQLVNDPCFVNSMNSLEKNA